MAEQERSRTLPVQRLERLAAWIDKFRDGVCGLLLLAIFALLNIQILYRYVLNNPLSWPEEIARTCFVWLAYVGVAKLIREKSFYAIDVFVASAPFRLRLVVSAIIDLMTLGIFCLIIVSSWQVLQANANTTTAIGVPINILYLSLPVAAVFIVFSLFLALLGSVSSGRNKD